MIAPWMIYIFLVSVGVAVAAAVFERALRATLLPARLIWAGAIFLPVLAAVWSARHWRVEDQHLVPSEEISNGATRRDQGGVATLRQWAPRQLTVAVSPDYASARFDSILLAIWLGGSLLTLAAFGGGAMRLRRIRSSAKVRNIGGARVAIAARTGPLVIGVIHPEIILPEWVLDFDRSQQQLVIAHEQEHVSGRDPALLAFAAVAVAAAPWNPLLWYMLRRLREAVELDCDRRVLGVHPDARAYAGLLLSVASRNQTNLLPVAGLAASVSSLEQRFRYMTMNSKHHSGYRLISTVAVVALLLVATAMIPRPIRGVNARTPATQSGARATGRVKVTSTSGSVTYRVYATGGTFTEAGMSARAKADTLIESISESTAGDLFDVDVTNGEVHFVAQNSHGIHLEAAMSGQSRALWLSATGPHLVITRGGAGILTDDPPEAFNPNTTTFFEYQVDKSVTLRESVKPRYPAALKSSGIRGEVWVQYVVDESGRVDMRTFKSLKSSAPEFTTAVKDVLPGWRFDPAIRQGRRVRQLVEQAFEFTLPPKA